MKLIGKEWQRDVECSGTHRGDNLGCGAPLRVKARDIYRLAMEFLTYEEGKIKNFFCCPVCHAETPIDLPSNVIPTGRRPKHTKAPIEKGLT